MGTKATDYKRAFNAEKYDRIELKVPKGRKAVIQSHSEAVGESLNGFVSKSIDERIERLGAGNDATEQKGEVDHASIQSNL